MEAGLRLTRPQRHATVVALRRFGLSRKSLEVISSIYQDPTFITKGPDDHTAKGSVGAGIRQGCPLSPYLFIMVVLEDVDWDLASQGIARNTWSVSRPTADIEYVDDTLLIARTTQLLAILHSLERHALQHRMNLNIWEKPLESAFRHRAALAETACKKLRLVWNSNLPRRTKLRIFQSTFIPTLIFGLDTLTLADKQVARVDAYYFRFLRRIVNIKASYSSRSTNNVVWRTCLTTQESHRPLSTTRSTSFLSPYFTRP